MHSELAKNIVATIAYYDGFNYPMTAFEVWKYLFSLNHLSADQIQIHTLEEVMEELQSESVQKNVSQKDGFYFLRGRSELVEQRQKRSILSLEKVKRLRRVAKILTFIPFVRMIGITGKLAMKNAAPSSDWDVFIVLKQGHIWTGRTLVTLVAHIIGKRRYGRYVRDRVCLNYFVADKALEIMTKDMYSSNEYFFMFPLFDDGVYKSFQLKNAWIQKFKPHYSVSEIKPSHVIKDSYLAKSIRVSLEFLFGSIHLERLLKSIEQYKIKRNPNTHREGSLVHTSDDALVFLPSPHGPEIFERYMQKMEHIKSM